MSNLTLANKQAALDTAALTIDGIIEQLHLGLITITEFSHAIAARGLDSFTVDYMAGLVCPYTGLRYPTQEELDIVDAQCGPLPIMAQINKA